MAAQIDLVVDLVEADWRSALKDAAWLHDVGYSPKVAVTSFHPLDGARWLRDHGWPRETCRLVAWHTEALEEARLYGLDTQLTAEFERPPRLAAAALAWADLTTSPTGAQWAAERRFADILRRYPPGSIVHEATRASLPSLGAAVRTIEDLLACPVVTPFRIGIGHDIHRLFPGRELVLGGVTVSTDVGFGTHTDGDVLCHALIDALAGAIADGDLGTHYPEDDPETDEARSLDFVEEFAGYVRRAGYEIANVDAFVVLGTVRLRPHIEAMRRNLAEALAMDIADVSVKARSNDGIGPEGEGEACAAWASVLVYPANG